MQAATTTQNQSGAGFQVPAYYIIPVFYVPGPISGTYALSFAPCNYQQGVMQIPNAPNQGPWQTQANYSHFPIQPNNGNYWVQLGFNTNQRGYGNGWNQYSASRNEFLRIETMHNILLERGKVRLSNYLPIDVLNVSKRTEKYLRKTNRKAKAWYKCRGTRLMFKEAVYRMVYQELTSGRPITRGEMGDLLSNVKGGAFVDLNYLPQPKKKRNIFRSVGSVLPKLGSGLRYATPLAFA